MRIAIITVFFNTNYGAVLQAYALSRSVQRISGRDCYLLDYRRKKLMNMFRNSIFDLDLKKNKSITRESIKRTLKQFLNPQGTIERFRVFEEFRNKYLTISDDTFFEGDNISLKNTDLLIVGSDQIWNPDITQGFNRVYFGKVSNKKIFTISYAASLGRSSLSEGERQELKELLENVDIISVREEEGASLIRELTDKKIKCVPDPTVLLGQKQWMEISSAIEQRSKPFIFVYMLAYSQLIIDIASDIRSKFEYDVVLFYAENMKPILGVDHKKNCSPSEFISFISQADYIVTNSFHGTVFSTIFHKQFLSVPHRPKSSRIINYCTKLGLDDRIVFNADEYARIDHSNQIDYTSIRKKIEGMRQEGEEFLAEALLVSKHGQI